MYSKLVAGREERMERWMDAWQPGQKSPEAMSVCVCLSMHIYAKLAFMAASIFSM